MQGQWLKTRFLAHAALESVGTFSRCVNPKFGRVVFGKLPRRSISSTQINTMKVVQFLNQDGNQKVGVQLENYDVLDLNASDERLPATLRECLDQRQDFLSFAERVVKLGSTIHPKDSIRLLAPITNPEKLLCIGMNYVDHCTEQNVPVPKEPVIFNKFSNAIVGPTDNIIYPDVTEQLDWEVELAIIVGKAGKNIKVEEAGDFIAGYTVAHDVSARDWQMKKNGRQWLLGKAMDTFCPLGPALVTKDSLSDPHNLGIRCRVNGQTVQDSNTSQMVFKSEQLIAHISQFMTLQAGDLILTGTPPGVGVFRKPPMFLQRGDVVECEIDEIGTIVNRVV